MELILYTILLIVALIIIAIGLFKSEHTEMALIGFVLLFLLAITLEAGSVTSQTGDTTNSSFTYSIVGNYTLLTDSTETVAYIYTPITMGGALSHVVGYWLAIMSVIGFVGVLVALRKQVYD